MFIRWKKTPPRKDGHVTLYAELVEAKRAPGDTPRQRVLAYLGSIRSHVLSSAHREAFFAQARKVFRRLKLEPDLRARLENQLEKRFRQEPKRMPRDGQRQRLYRSERAVPHGDRFTSVAHCQAYVEDRLRSPWWRNSCPDIPSVTVTDGRSRRHAGAVRSRRIIKLPRWSRTELTILHELAHIATPEGCAAHGPEYARTYLELVRRFMGREAGAELRKAFQSHRVKVHESSRGVLRSRF